MIDRNTVKPTIRFLQVASAIVWCLFVAGTCFGFAALKPVLISEGVYRELCTPEEIEKGVHICREQELSLNMMFTIAAVVTNITALVVGSALDLYGPKFCGVLGSILITLACLVLRSASTITLFDGYKIGYGMLAIAGPFTFISSFHLSNAFPQYSGLILAFITGAFDSSSAVFLFYRLAYEHSNGSFTLYKFFTVFLIAPIFIFFVQIFLMPSESYASPTSPAPQKIRRMSYIAVPDGSSAQPGGFRSRHASFVESTAFAGGNVALFAEPVADEDETADETTPLTNGSIQAAKKNAKSSGVEGILHGKSAIEQLKTPWFIFIALFTTIQMLRINYFVASVLSQYTYLLGSFEKATHLNKFFDIALPLGGLVSIPFIGLALDNLSTFGVLSVLLSVSTTFGVLGMIPNSFLAGCLNVMLLVVYRPFYYTSVSDYAAKVFGFETFGRIYGVVICIAGVLNVLQAQLDRATHDVFNSNPTPVNIILVSITVVIGVSFLIYVKTQVQARKRKELEIEASGAVSESLAPTTY